MAEGHEGPKELDAEAKLARMEILISRVLQIGVTLSAVIIGAGLIWFLVAHASGYPTQAFPRTIGGVLAGIGARKPYALISVGLLALILTPFVRVAVSLGTFLLERDRLYVFTTVFVLFVLIFSWFLGTVLR